jgi:general stress protein 26
MYHMLIRTINHVCIYRKILFIIFSFCLQDVSISGRADLVHDNTKKKDLWSDSLKAW